MGILPLHMVTYSYIIIMLQFSRLIALVLLMVCWQVTGDDQQIVYFGCKKNVDGLCSYVHTINSDLQTLIWAERSIPGKRDYECGPGWKGQCCPQHQFQEIDNSSTGSITKPVGATSNCQHYG
ncbi:hypothetical protein H4Q26_012430 [Puccinia striiformis f. sp. tritici PST-130]|nr:hypothetical protein H4Q26_010402 [Puccinia striiformis f. sp. tritici PST-130]KAI9618608.1 hypothetical protein H4Q26_012430 [Puccinia striiformis f. sp. tritici PST-130]